MLSPLLYSLFTHDCVTTHTSNSVIKFAEDTTLLGLITNIDQTAYREEVRALMEENNLSLKVKKTKELIVEHTPIHIGGSGEGMSNRFRNHSPRVIPGHLHLAS